MIQGVIFDLDGTIFEGDYDWPEIKRRLGLPANQSTILEYLETLPPNKKQQKQEILERFEHEATRDGHLKPGARELLQDLRQMGLKLALVTNNSRTNAEWILERYELHFDCVLTREIGFYKPSAKPFLHAAVELGLQPGELASVGDNEFDLMAGRDAGMALVIIVNSEVGRFKGHCDHAVHDLTEVQEILRKLHQLERPHEES